MRWLEHPASDDGNRHPGTFLRRVDAERTSIRQVEKRTLIHSRQSLFSRH